jgi:hypothetical protein
MLALSSVFDTASQVLNVGITLRRRTVYSPVITGLALAVNVGLNFMLIPRYGPLGASISTLLSYIAFCGLRFWFSNLFFKVEYEWVRVFNSMTIGGLLILGYYLVDTYRGQEPSVRALIYSIGFKLLLALSFPALLYVAGVYNKRELQRLAQLASKLGLRSISSSDSGVPAPASTAAAGGGVAVESPGDQAAQPRPGGGGPDLQ